MMLLRLSEQVVCWVVVVVQVSFVGLGSSTGVQASTNDADCKDCVAVPGDHINQLKLRNTSAGKHRFWTFVSTEINDPALVPPELNDAPYQNKNAGERTSKTRRRKWKSHKKTPRWPPFGRKQSSASPYENLILLGNLCDGSVAVINRKLVDPFISCMTGSPEIFPTSSGTPMRWYLTTLSFNFDLTTTNISDNTMLSSSIRSKKTTKPHHLHHRRHNHHHNSSLTTITDDELYDTSGTSGDGTMTNIGHASDVIDEIPLTSSSLSDVITGASSAPRRYLSRMTSSHADAEPGFVQTGEHLNLHPYHEYSTAQTIFDHNIRLPPDYRVVLPNNVTSPFADITEDSLLNRRSIPAFNPSFKDDYVQPLAAGSGWNDTIVGSVAVLTETTPGSSTAPSFFSDRTRYLGSMDRYRTIQIRPRSRMTYPIAVFHPTEHPVTTPSEAAVFDSMVRRELLTFKIVFGTSAFVVIFVLILVLVFCVLLACGCHKSRRSHRKSRRTDRKTNDSRLPNTTDQATSALALNAPSPVSPVAPTLADAPVAAPSPVVPTPAVPPAASLVTPTVSSCRVLPMASATGIPAVSAAENSSSDCTTGVPATEGVDETVAAIQVADDHNTMAIGNAETKSESVEGHSKPDQGRWLVPNVVAHDNMHGLKTTTVPSSSSSISSAAATTTTPTLANDALGERIVDPSMRNILSAKLDGKSRKKKGWKVYSGQYVNEWFV